MKKYIIIFFLFVFLSANIYAEEVEKYQVMQSSIIEVPSVVQEYIDLQYELGYEFILFYDEYISEYILVKYKEGYLFVEWTYPLRLYHYNSLYDTLNISHINSQGNIIDTYDALYFEVLYPSYIFITSTKTVIDGDYIEVFVNNYIYEPKNNTNIEIDTSNIEKLISKSNQLLIIISSIYIINFITNKAKILRGKNKI